MITEEAQARPEGLEERKLWAEERVFLSEQLTASILDVVFGPENELRVLVEPRDGGPYIDFMSRRWAGRIRLELPTWAFSPE